jgi:meiotic recombination protein SPO11
MDLSAAVVPVGSSQQPASQHEALLSITSEEVVGRIEDAVASIVEMMDEEKLPSIHPNSNSGGDKCLKRFTLVQSRSFTSVLMVLSYCHSLLGHNRSTTTREVYYFFVTHFRNQRECDHAIWETAELIGVPRVTLGLAASPKGWFCGSLEISRNGNVTDAQALSSIQGLPITREWFDWKQHFQIKTAATCIIVIEKEGIYNRLSEDRFFERVPCILVTGKGFPDLATRAFVSSLYQQFNLPVYGICDCNPYGVGVLWTYYKGSKRIGLDGEDRYSVPIQWLGLRPKQVEKLRKAAKLPPDVYQQMTDFDRKKLESFCQESHEFQANGTGRLEELLIMQKNGYKVELEALQWMGMNYICDWLEEVLEKHEDGEEGWII